MLPEDALSHLEEEAHHHFAERHAARERSLALTRVLIRHAGNAIRAVHRRDDALASGLLADARAVIDQMTVDLAAVPDLLHSGYVGDALKEYAEARATYALIVEDRLPSAASVDVGLVPYLHGVAECVGELRRFALDALRRGDVATGERMLGRMDAIYEVLVTLDYPDAITGGLRRTTDVARGILEKTRGDLTSAVQADRVARALATAQTIGRGEG